jgi:hypothetical protein
MLAASVLALLSASALAQVTTFGSDLAQPSNVTFDCSVWPVPVIGLVPSGAQTCTWSSSESVAQTLIVPGNGTVTQARVKVGPITGPMQVVVLRALRDGFTNRVGCCQQVGQSTTFTPQADAVTAVPLALPVRNDAVPDENNIFAFDILALSILAPGVPIPAFDTGNYTPSGPNDAIDFPASQPNASIQPADSFGYVVQLNGDWVAGTGGPGTGPGGPPTTSGPPLVFASPAALVQANKALIDLTCTLAGPCPGRLRLQDRPAPGATIIPATAAALHPTARAARLVTYAAGRFKLAGGQTGTVKARLRPKGRRLSRAQPSATVWANVTFTGSKPAQVISAQVTLSR